MTDKITCETIVSWLKKQIEERQPIGPDIYMEAAVKLNILIEDETDKFFLMEQEIAKVKLVLLREGKSVAAAKVEVEASDEFREVRKQAAKVERIVEFIRLAKKMSTTVMR